MAILDSCKSRADREKLNSASLENKRGPRPRQKVFKDECMNCFRTPLFPDGLFVCMDNYFGFCDLHAREYTRRTNKNLFLNIKQSDVDKKQKIESDPEPVMKVPRADKDQKIYHVCKYPELSKLYPVEQEILGLELFHVARLIIEHASADVQTRVENSCDWTGEPLLETRLVENLQQIPVKKEKPSTGWQCQEPGCTFTDNLWLNLVDGKVLCGRGQMLLDGNNHSLKHAKETGRQLVVRLGTIENGKGEVYNYSFDDPNNEGFVRNPYLHQHLKTFGLDINKFKKTEQSFTEIEKSIVFKYDWDTIEERGVILQPVYGPGFTGLINLGSSCYMSSVLQSLLVIPEFVRRYDRNASLNFNSIEYKDAYDDFNWQLSKLLHCMNSDDSFSKQNSKLNGIKPVRFKDVTGKGHPEFSTSKQQDVEHYIRHLMEVVDKYAPSGKTPVDGIRFKLFQRFEDIASGKVRYSSHNDVILPLNLPNEYEFPAEDEPSPRSNVTLAQCIARTFDDDIIEDYISPVTKEKKGAKQCIRMGTFPDILLIQLKRFAYTSDGKQKKLPFDVHDVDELNLENYKTNGIQLHEQPLTATEDDRPLTGRQINVQNATAQLLNMGFTENAIKRAIHFVNSTDANELTNWIISNIDNPDLNEPFSPSLVKSCIPTPAMVVEEIMSMGFSHWEATYSLQLNNQQKSDAVNWLIEHRDQVPSEPEPTPMDVSDVAGTSTEVGDKKLQVHDGQGVYDLCGFISHIGSNPTMGHYVTHLKKQDTWYIYNDEKVCISQRPPKTCGYVYLYKRREREPLP